MSQACDSPTTLDFDSILRQYGALVSKVCYFYATDVCEFDDLRQEALLTLWKGLPKFNGEAGLSTWIYRVTLNSCVSYFRKNRRGANADPIENHPEIIADDDHEKAMMVKEMYGLINCLGDLDKAVILMWLDGYDYESIAAVVGMNKTTVGTRIFRIKERLKELSNK